VYTVTADMSSLPADTERILVRMRFFADADVYYVDGFTGMSRYNDGAIEASAWVNISGDNRPLTIFVPGGSLTDYSLNAFKSHDSDKPLENVGLNVTRNPKASANILRIAGRRIQWTRPFTGRCFRM
jgi:hypothetical protein